MPTKKPVSTVSYDEDQPLFVTWDDSKPGSKDVAFSKASKALDNPDAVIPRGGPVERAMASNIYMNIAPSQTSIREGFTRRDYEMFRPAEALPNRIKDIIVASNDCYRRIGLVRNVIDLMTDFTVQGIDLVHPNPKIEQWHKNWFSRVDGSDRSERFCNNVYRLGNVICKRTMGTLKESDREDIQQGNAGALIDELRIKPKKPPKHYRIPLRYTFLNPLTVEVMNEDLAPFVGEDGFIYSLRIPDSLAKQIKAPKNKEQAGLVNQIPSNIRQMIQDGKRLVPLPSDTISVYSYKKDDWQVWGEPLVNAVMEDLRMLQKMKLADLAALDGAISHIRVWRLGSLEHKLLPTDAAVNRLANMLINNVGGGSIDLIWGPDLELQETSTDVYKFLGQEKYAPVLNAIYAGLGIPPTLTGGAQSAGFTNNFISLRTLTERLNYGRRMLMDFWAAELKMVQRAMGFRFPAQIIFDRPVLTDEAAELSLLIQLADRDIISTQSVQERFNLLPEIEQLRIKREFRQRESHKMPDKVSPFHNPNPEVDLKKIALQTGQATPAEVGLELDPDDGQKTMLEQQQDLQLKTQKVQQQGQQQQNDHQFRMEKLQMKHGVHPAQQQQDGQPGAGTPPGGKPKGQPGQGRPTNSKDSTKRKQKTVNPRKGAPAQRARASAEFMMDLTWAREAQRSISEVVHPAFLASKSKKNVRQLTDGEVGELERFKFAVLCNMPLHSALDQQVIAGIIEKPLPIPNTVEQLNQVFLDKYVEKNHCQPSIEDMRQIQASVYVLANGGETEGEDESGES
jgi:hypothetical protein